jgi:lysozyme family protein
MTLDDLHSNAEGSVVKFTAVSAMENISGFAGEEGNDVYSYFCLGNKKCQKRKEEKQASKNRAREVKAGAKATKAEAKVQEAEAKKMTADAAKEGVKGDVALADAIAKSAPVQAIQGMSTPAKIGIGVGVLALLGFGAYMIFKKKKK